MKYMLLIYNNQSAYESLPEEERQAIFTDVEAIMNELRGSGELVGSMALADQSLSKTVRVRDGAITATMARSRKRRNSSPATSPSTREPERAVEIAARWPDARYSRWRSGRSCTTRGPTSDRARHRRGPAT